MVVWTDTSIMHITDFINEAKNGSEQTAKTYINKLIDYVDTLEVMPNIGKDFSKLLNNYKLKQLIYKKHRIIYYIKGKDVVILAVIHTKLDVKKAMKSIKKRN